MSYSRPGLRDAECRSVIGRPDFLAFTDLGADIGWPGLTFVCTDPAYQGRGAGSLLSRKVLEMAAADGMPVYLESTEVAIPMYEKLGFKVIDGFEMEIPSPGSAGLTEVYREACMVWYPPQKQDDRSGERG
jgi:GNAT superfamily N-acetyltransferase